MHLRVVLLPLLPMITRRAISLGLMGYALQVISRAQPLRSPACAAAVTK